jgi:hypothetical protein
MRARAFKEIRRIQVENGDVIVVRKWQGMTQDDKENITKTLQDRLRHSSYGVTLLFVDSLSDVRTMNEKQMLNNGWARVK